MDEALIRIIMEEVMKALDEKGCSTVTPYCGSDTMLVIGCCQNVPDMYKENYNLVDIEDYKQNPDVCRYKKIFIEKLTLTELSDIALGRDASAVSCAVVNGLLCGLEVVMKEEALPHRKFAGKGSTRMYQVIENNVRQLESFGVKILPAKRVAVVKEPTPPKFNPPKIVTPKGTMRPNEGQLITEAIAIDLVKTGETEITLPKSAIITPSAWDVFTKNKVNVTKN